MTPETVLVRQWLWEIILLQTNPRMSRKQREERALHFARMGGGPHRAPAS